MIGRAEIEKLVPQRGKMCLLDAVVHCDPERIVCHTRQHRAPDNPLCAGGRLAAIHAIEFAAQAMAMHQRLTGVRDATPRDGLLVSVRQCELAVDRLDGCASPLVIEATRLAAGADAFTYRFTIGAAEVPIASGRASVVLRDAGPP